MNMEEYYCLAHLHDSVLLNNNNYKRKHTIFFMRHMRAPVSVIRFALGVFLHCVFN